MKAWKASKLETKEGKVSYELTCDTTDEEAMRKILEVFFNLIDVKPKLTEVNERNTIILV